MVKNINPKNNFSSGVVFILFLLLIFLMPAVSLAQDEQSQPAASGGSASERALEMLDETAQQAQLISEGEPPNIYQIVGNLINIVLGFLGVVFLVLIIYGGVVWMKGSTVVGGGAKKVDINKAKQIIVQATFGLIIVLFAFLFTNFVVFKIINTITSTP